MWYGRASGRWARERDGSAAAAAAAVEGRACAGWANVEEAWNKGTIGRTAPSLSSLRGGVAGAVKCGSVEVWIPLHGAWAGLGSSNVRAQVGA